MNESKYLENLTKECNEIRAAIAKRTLISVIILAVLAVIAYVGLISLDSRAASVAVMLSSLLGLIALIFFIKFLILIKEISYKTLAKCQQEIQKNLKENETFETFDKDITIPAFGAHSINAYKISIGHTFVLFQRLTSKGPHFQILRGDNLGNFDVHSFSQNGVGTDIGMDIKDTNGKFIRSIMTSDKERFYELLNAMESIKRYANGDTISEMQYSANQNDPFVEEVKNGVKRQTKKGYTKIGVFGIIFGIFLVIAGSSSGEAFIYGGFTLMVLSIIFIIYANIKFKRQ
jgi:ABC-type multidrug transport system fused ATPase/permease subunit